MFNVTIAFRLFMTKRCRNFSKNKIATSAILSSFLVSLRVTSQRSMIEKIIIHKFITGKFKFCAWLKFIHNSQFTMIMQENHEPRFTHSGHKAFRNVYIVSVQQFLCDRTLFTPPESARNLTELPLQERKGRNCSVHLNFLCTVLNCQMYGSCVQMLKNLDVSIKRNNKIISLCKLFYIVRNYFVAVFFN